jgi:hypothetical protein
MPRFVFGLYSLVLLCLAGSAHAAINESWTPPTGIPMPPFGIRDSHWMYAGSQYAFNYGSGNVPYRQNEFGPYTHYVDANHSNATDTNNPYGTPTTPRRTWPYPLPAGAAVQVRSGTYSFTNGPGGALVVGGNGTAALPIFVYGTSDDEAAVPRISKRGAFFIWGNWTVLERFRFMDDTCANTRPLLKGAPVLSVAVRYCRFTGTGATDNPLCVSSGGSSGNSAANYTRDFIVFGNVMRDYGNWQATVENDACGAILSQHCTNAWLLENDIYHMGGDSVRIGADQGDEPSGQNYYIGRNRFHDNRENGIDVKQAVNAVISENLMYNFTSSGSSSGEAAVIHYDPKNIWFINNTIHDTRRGIVCTGIGGDHLYIIGNILYNTTDAAIYPDRGGGTIHIYNNTLHNCAEGIVSTGVITAVHVHGNIVCDVAGPYLQVEQSTVRSASSVSHELYYRTGGGSITIDWGSTLSSILSLISGTSIGDNSLQADPRFVSASGRDYRLQSNSPAIGAGYNLSALNSTFQQRFGVSMLRDPAGTPRATGGSYDMGAYEYADGTQATVPTAPGGLAGTASP